MKSTAVAILSVILLPLASYGQSTLSFPRVMQPQDFSTTGFALVNPGSASADVIFTLYGLEGGSRGTSTQRISGRGQLSKLANELFPSSTSAGWIQATSLASGLQGFWFSGDLTTFADGAEAAVSGTELVLPMMSPDSEIHIANTGTTAVTLLLNLLSTDGFELAEPFVQRIPAKGFLSRSMVSLFPTLTDLSLPSHMRVTCGCPNASPFAATVIARNHLGVAPSWAVSNGVPAASTATTVYFPYLVEGPQGNANWRSVLGLTNLSTTVSNDVTLTFVSTSGGIVRTNQQTLPANGGLRFSARDLFGLSTGFQTGWVTATSALPLTGYISYADVIAAGVAVVAPQQQAQSSLLFAHIADLPPWLTGIVLLNTGAADANIDVFALNPNGSLIGAGSFSLAAGANTAKLLRDVIPQTQMRTSDGGFLFVQSSVPIYGIELFFSRNLQILANVPAGPGATFVPPR